MLWLGGPILQLIVSGCVIVTALHIPHGDVIRAAHHCNTVNILHGDVISAVWLVCGSRAGGDMLLTKVVWRSTALWWMPIGGVPTSLSSLLHLILLRSRLCLPPCNVSCGWCCLSCVLLLQPCAIFPHPAHIVAIVPQPCNELELGSAEPETCRLESLFQGWNCQSLQILPGVLFCRCWLHCPCCATPDSRTTSRLAPATTSSSGRCVRCA
mmetsp:Transcript_92597/g.177793  ORF Transcript_92597/g.177793 Transcript_92597/m.177793 type:complete len:211 (+) Transcript_92597:455-1087(+)